MSSNPWSSAMPGGVDFRRPDSDCEEAPSWRETASDPCATDAFIYLQEQARGESLAQQPASESHYAAAEVMTVDHVEAPSHFAPAHQSAAPSGLNRVPASPQMGIPYAPAPAHEAAPADCNEEVDEPDLREDARGYKNDTPIALVAPVTAETAKVPRAQRPVAVTVRDTQILTFLARYRYATYAQLAGAFHMSESALRHRMPRLAREGLVIRRPVGHMSHGVWLPTKAGLQLAQMDLPLPTLSWGTVAHTLGLVKLGNRFEALGEVVVTEREIRAADTRDRFSPRMLAAAEMTNMERVEDPHLYVVPLDAGSGQRTHIPDMVLVRPLTAEGVPGSVAIELELNRKTPAQWRKILAAYKRATKFARVVYYSHDASIRNGILRAAESTGTSHMVEVHDFDSLGSSGP